tara:strand:+ start:88 stop:285 length:198 start_codon:yes stop_codon:yes gene_type:complete
MPVNIEIEASNDNNFEFFRPEYLKISISLFSKSFIKNNCVVIKKIKGNISKIMSGELRSDKINGK